MNEINDKIYKLNNKNIKIQRFLYYYFNIDYKIRLKLLNKINKNCKIINELLNESLYMY